jgi:hypothetical protein
MHGPLGVFDEATKTPIPLEHDEWVEAIIDGPLLVGVSEGGRVMICSDWESTLKDQRRVEDCFAVVEIDYDAGANLGRLSVKFGRVAFEILYAVRF